MTLLQKYFARRNKICCAKYDFVAQNLASKIFVVHDWSRKAHYDRVCVTEINIRRAKFFGFDFLIF